MVPAGGGDERKDVGATVPPWAVSETVYVWSAFIRRRNREGRSCSSLASARREVSSMPATVPPAAVRSAIATATASSSSSRSGGSSAPGPS